MKYLLIGAMVLVLLTFPWLGSIHGSVEPSAVFAGGDGSLSNPYQISTLNELQSVGSYTSSHFVLINDINATATVDWNAGYGFKPIGGTTWQTNFKGTMDGGGYNITNLCIKRSSSDYIGLFAYTNTQVRIKNVNLVNADISGNTYVGGIVGYSYGYIGNCYVSGTIAGKTEKAGGIAGAITYNWGIMTGCNVTAKVTGKNQVGGLVGLNDGTVQNCTRFGDTIGSWQVGGAIGNNYNYTKYCYSIGYTSGGSNAGGFVGENGGVITDCYSQGKVYGSSSINKAAGGFVGENDAKITNCYSTTLVTVNGNQNPKGMGFCVSAGTSATMTGNFWDNMTSGQMTTGGNATGKNTTEMMKLSTYTWAGWDIIGLSKLYTKLWYIDEEYDYPRLSFQEYIDIRKPEADAGADVLVNINGTVRFDGSGSTDNLKVVRYKWSFYDRGLIDLYGVDPEHRFEKKGNYIVTLTTYDEAGHFDTDTMNVTVKDIEKPKVDAGPDQTVDMHTEVIFDGSKCTDNVRILLHTWNFFDGETVILNGVQPSYTFDHAGIFEVELNVTDLSQNWNTSTMTVTVNDTESPVAEAGPDVLIDMGSPVTLNGSGSMDNVGVVHYTWTFFDMEQMVLNGISVTHEFSSFGDTIVTLNVSDGRGNWDTDTMHVLANDWIPPVALGGDDIVVDMGETVNFNGSNSFDNVILAGYVWTFHDVVDVVLHGRDPQYRFNNSGIFMVTLNVSDTSGNWAIDSINVTVRDTMPPVADAGPDLVADMGSEVNFDGSGSMDNVAVVNYTWYIEDDGEVILYGIDPSYVFRSPGIYNVTLKVSDAASNHMSDTVLVIIRDIEPPIANAGMDMEIEFRVSMTLDGTMSKDNVGIVNYTWSFNDGEHDILLYGPATDHIFIVPGIYAVTLNVTDEAGNWAIDRMNLTVQDLIDPVAVPGPDRIVAIGSVVFLDGSGSSDNDMIRSYTWSFDYGGEIRVLEGYNVSFEFDNEGKYEITLKVYDRFGNEDEDRFVLDVEKNGTFFGRVVDENGKPMASAEVEITLPNGDILRTSSNTNGSFSIDIPEGPFTWKISKSGYKPSSGSSSIRAVERKELDEMEAKITKESTFSPLLFLIAIPILLVMLVIIVFLILIKRKKGSDGEEEVAEEDKGGNTEGLENGESAQKGDDEISEGLVEDGSQKSEGSGIRENIA